MCTYCDHVCQGGKLSGAGWPAAHLRVLAAGGLPVAAPNAAGLEGFFFRTCLPRTHPRAFWSGGCAAGQRARQLEPRWRRPLPRLLLLLLLPVIVILFARLIVQAREGARIRLGAVGVVEGCKQQAVHGLRWGVWG